MTRVRRGRRRLRAVAFALSTLGGTTAFAHDQGGGVAVRAPDAADWTATFSIVAHDPATGETGLAKKSRAFRSSARGLWTKPGVGAIVAQADFNLSYGPDGLRLLGLGVPPEEVVRRLTGPDPLRGERQLGVVDVHGRAAAYTGRDTFYAASHIVGEGFAVQGNNLESEAVVPAMAAGFRAAKGDLAARMLSALEAGQALGGDGRGYGSAVIQVVKDGYLGTPADPTHLDPYWVDVRVDYSRDALSDLGLLLRQTQVRRLVATGQKLAEEGKPQEAVDALVEALVLFPDDEQIRFRLAERYADADRREDALRELRQAVRISPALKYAAARSSSLLKMRDDPRFLELVRREGGTP